MIGLVICLICNLHNRALSARHMAPLPCFILPGQMCYCAYSSTKLKLSREDADMSAEKKLSEGDADVGKSFKVGGCHSTKKEFHTIPEWELELKHLPLMVLKIMSYINLYIAKVFGCAPMVGDLSPTICSFLEVVEEDVDNSIVEAALEVGKVPHIKEGVKMMVEKFQKKQEGLKKRK